jgi:hypothetical protein
MVATAVDYTDAINTVYILSALIFGGLGLFLFRKAGGWPEGFYILFGIDYFQPYIIQANAKIRRYFVKMSQVRTHSAAMFTIGKGKDAGDYLMPTEDDEKFNNPHNAPAALYEYGDSRPIPIKNRSSEKVDPVLVHTAFNNDALEKLNDPSRRHPKRVQTGVLVFLLFVAILMAMLSAYYSYNAACAAHSAVCVQTGGH